MDKWDKIVSVLSEVEKERYRQEEKWGEQNHPADHYYCILGEEFGEVGKAICETPVGKATIADVRAELIQVAAVAVAMVESIDRNGR